MIISVLIEELEDKKRKHGDIEVYIGDGDERFEPAVIYDDQNDCVVI